MKVLFGMYVAVMGGLGYAYFSGGGFRTARAQGAATYGAVKAADQSRVIREEAKRTPVIVELFTSEGCSSCPPADALLARLNNDQPVSGASIIALEEHVDYWDHLGWRDPYSGEKFTERQNSYAGAFQNAGVYTPQMVVDGRLEFVGSHERKARQAIAESAKAPKREVLVKVAAEAAGASEIPLEIHVEKISGLSREDRPEIFLAITESGLHSEVARGENAGRKLDHFGVVRSLERVGAGRAEKDGNTETGFSVTTRAKLASTWKRENLHVVCFIQDKHSRHILGATEIPLR